MSNPGAEAIVFFRNRYSIDSAAMSSLLSIALSRGGDFAELFFEHRTNSAIQWEDQRVKSASRNVAQGVGIRVVKGDAIGYAYTESLDMDAMRRAAETASRIGTDDVAIPAPVGPGARMKSRLHFPHRLDPAILGQERIQRLDQAEPGPAVREGTARGHSRGVDSRVGASGGVHPDRAVTDLLQDGFDLPLDRAPPGLSLPSGEPRSVIL